MFSELQQNRYFRFNIQFSHTLNGYKRLKFDNFNLLQEYL